MAYIIDIQNINATKLPMSNELLSNWAETTLRSEVDNGELTVRITDAEEMTYLNSTYRQKNKVTNVLSFPASVPKIIDLDATLLGDVIICPEVVAQESQDLNKSYESHFALMVVHGVLHLLGYDHIENKDAEVMQSKEIKILNSLGYSNPYSEESDEI